MPPTDLPTPPNDPTRPALPRRGAGEDSGSDNQANVAGMMVGTVMMFIGFLDVFMSISAGFEINYKPFILYFGGVTIWAYSVIKHPTLRYTVMTAAIVFALAFFHYGEVLFWHKQVVFWVTVVIVVFFMFKTAPPSRQ